MPQRVKNFWAAYRDVVLSGGMPEKIADWHFHWGEGFAKFIKGKPLKERTSRDVEKYLKSLGEQRKTRPWQLDQARDAIRILYHGFLGIPLPMPNSTDANTALSETDKTPQDQKFEDTITEPERFDVRFGTMISQIWAEIRYRHYSIRTEHSYTCWIKRFLNFHQLRQA